MFCLCAIMITAVCHVTMADLFPERGSQYDSGVFSRLSREDRDQVNVFCGLRNENFDALNQDYDVDIEQEISNAVQHQLNNPSSFHQWLAHCVLVEDWHRPKRLQFPWAARIMIVDRELDSIKNSKTNYVTGEYRIWTVCGGTIISNRHIITAAHCLFPFTTADPANKVLVYLGRPMYDGLPLHRLSSNNLFLEKARRVNPHFVPRHIIHRNDTPKLEDVEIQNEEWDLAVIDLEREIPKEMIADGCARPICVQQFNQPLPIGIELVFSNFRSCGERALQEMPLLQLWHTATVVDCQPYFVRNTHANVICFDQSNPPGLGKSDSGSGYYLNTTKNIWVLAGVHKGERNTCKFANTVNSKAKLRWIQSKTGIQFKLP